jgi:hypothetical protein
MITVPEGDYCPPRGKKRCPHRGCVGSSHLPYCEKFHVVISQGNTKERQLKEPKCLEEMLKLASKDEGIDNRTVEQ